jgi:hypothetical protein
MGCAQGRTCVVDDVRGGCAKGGCAGYVCKRGGIVSVSLGHACFCTCKRVPVDH